MFLSLLTLPTETLFLPPRELLILDEAHRLEEEIVKFTGISISKKRYRRYIPNFKIVDYGNDMGKWKDFFFRLAEEIKTLIDSHAIFGELVVEAETDIDKLLKAITDIAISGRDNWIVSDVKKEKNEVTRIELKPLDISFFASYAFQRCNKILMMSATILDKDALCKILGLKQEEVKFIQVPSDFPLQNRPIYPMNVAYLNYEALHKDNVKQAIAGAIDKIMTHHKDLKGIVHLTSYEQLNFIKEHISIENRGRLIQTDPEVERVEIIKEHINTT